MIKENALKTGIAGLIVAGAIVGGAIIIQPTTHYYFGPWILHDDPQTIALLGLPLWSGPDGATNAIDLRGKNDLSADGYGVFVSTKDLGDPYVKLADTPDGLLDSKAIQTLEDKLGSPISSTKFKDVLYEITVTDADPTGETRARPFTPDSNGDIVLYLGKEVVNKKPSAQDNIVIAESIDSVIQDEKPK